MHLKFIESLLQNKLNKVADQFEDCKTMGYQSADPTGERIVVQCEKPFENTRLYLVDVADTSKSEFFWFEKRKRKLYYISEVMLGGSTKAYIPFDVPLLKFGKFKLPSGIGNFYTTKF